MLFKKSLKGELNELIKMLENTGLSNKDIVIIDEFVNYNEEGLAIDHAITQLYEFNIPITQDIYNKIEKIAKRMKIKDEEYQILKELINGVN